MTSPNGAIRKAAAYVRVSSEEQTEGWSLEGQEQQIREYAGRNGYQIVQVYRDEMSGSKDKRPGLVRMLMDAHAGLFQAIIVIHTSRFFRNVSLARKYKDMLRNKLNIEVVFINQPVIDPNDPGAFMMEGIKELFDEYYLHQLRFWTSLGKHTRAQNGMWNGTLPFGYVTDRQSYLPVPHPKNAEGLKMAFEAYATGRYTDAGIADLLNREGYRTTGNYGERPFTKDTVNRMLRNVFYLGLVKYKGDLYPGKHPALVSQELFDQAQDARLRRRSKRRAFGQRSRVYILFGLARCRKCGLTLRAGATGSKGGYRYYRHMAKARGYDCSVPGTCVRAGELEEQWSGIVSRITLPADWRRRIQDLVGDADEREQILRERKRVEEKLKRLKELYRDLVIEEEEYRASLKQLQSQLATLVLPNSPQLIQAGEYLENLATIWQAATLEEQRDITRMLVRNIYVDVSYGAIIAVEPAPIFRLLFTQICEDLDIDVR
jgi:DNA invertase Pin-like site-specific DNA recombinase